MSFINTIYTCSVCNHRQNYHTEFCPSCKSKDSFNREFNFDNNVDNNNFSTFNLKKVNSLSTVNLSDIVVSEQERISTGLNEFDRVLGGGLVKESSVLIGGEPGVGKSTLMLQCASYLSLNHSVVYITGEETDEMVKSRYNRLNIKESNIKLFNSTYLDDITDMLFREKPEVIFVDSLQTLCSRKIDSYSGSPSQVKYCLLSLTETIKILGISMFVIAHINKDGGISGPKFAEHVVDAVLYFENADEEYRIIRANKNRYGSSDEIGIFLMNNNGLVSVDDPSTLFMVERVKDEPCGVAKTVIKEGNRALLVEIQVLCTPNKLQNSRIYSDNIEITRVQRVLAILESQFKTSFAFNDIYINVAGGIKLKSPSIEVCLSIALLSSFYNINIKEKSVFVGELTLQGEVRKPQFNEKLKKCAEGYGFNYIEDVGKIIDIKNYLVPDDKTVLK